MMLHRSRFFTPFAAGENTARCWVALLLLAAVSGLLVGCGGRTGTRPAHFDEAVIRFTYISDEAASVCITGDFNGWSKDSDCLLKTGKTWSIALPLPPGRYQYAFILDGRTWIKDPSALLSADNGFGTENSVLIVY